MGGPIHCDFDGVSGGMPTEEKSASLFSADSFSWNSVGWVVALLIGVWGVLLGIADYRDADAVLAASITVACVKWGHTTNLFKRSRRPVAFLVGVTLAITAAITLVRWTHRLALNTAEDKGRLAQLEKIPDLNNQIRALKTQNDDFNTKLQKKEEIIEGLASLTVRQGKTILEKTTLTTFERQDRFVAEVPFFRNNRFSNASHIAFDDNTNDPLFVTYGALTAISEVPAQIDQKTIQTYLGEVLQYFSLRSLFEIESPAQTFSMSPAHGFTTNAPPAISVPDAQAYSESDWSVQIHSLGLNYIRPGRRDDWLPKDLEIPIRTKVTVSQSPDGSAFTIDLRRLPDYSLEIKIEPAGRAEGAFPPHFIPTRSPFPHDSWLFTYTIAMHFKWSGDRDKGQEYATWATGLFAGLKKRLAVEE
jgi:hypothetical protein